MENGLEKYKPRFKDSKNCPNHIKGKADMDRDEQIKIVKQLRERFGDDVYDLLDSWVDALDQAGAYLPGEPLMDEYTRVFKAKDVIGSFDDYEDETEE